MKHWPVILLLILAACATVDTVVPDYAVPEVASIDPATPAQYPLATSGYLATLPDGSGIVTDTAVARYNALTELYGPEFTPPLKPGDGISAYRDVHGNELHRMTAAAVLAYAKMKRWHKNGVRPKGTLTRAWERIK
jgi:hypothetical protein